jgi:hypothetical protein
MRVIQRLQLGPTITISNTIVADVPSRDHRQRLYGIRRPVSDSPAGMSRTK